MDDQRFGWRRCKPTTTSPATTSCRWPARAAGAGAVRRARALQADRFHLSVAEAVPVAQDTGAIRVPPVAARAGAAPLAARDAGALRRARCDARRDPPRRAARRGHAQRRRRPDRPAHALLQQPVAARGGPAQPRGRPRAPVLPAADCAAGAAAALPRAAPQLERARRSGGVRFFVDAAPAGAAAPRPRPPAGRRRRVGAAFASGRDCGRAAPPRAAGARGDRVRRDRPVSTRQDSAVEVDDYGYVLSPRDTPPVPQSTREAIMRSLTSAFEALDASPMNSDRRIHEEMLVDAFTLRRPRWRQHHSSVQHYAQL